MSVFSAILGCNKPGPSHSQYIYFALSFWFIYLCFKKDYPFLVVGGALKKHTHDTLVESSWSFAHDKQKHRQTHTCPTLINSHKINQMNEIYKTKLSFSHRSIFNDIVQKSKTQIFICHLLSLKYMAAWVAKYAYSAQANNVRPFYPHYHVWLIWLFTFNKVG